MGYADYGTKRKKDWPWLLFFGGLLTVSVLITYAIFNSPVQHQDPEEIAEIVSNNAASPSTTFTTYTDNEEGYYSRWIEVPQDYYGTVNEGEDITLSQLRKNNVITSIREIIPEGGPACKAIVSIDEAEVIDVDIAGRILEFYKEGWKENNTLLLYIGKNAYIILYDGEDEARNISFSEIKEGDKVNIVIVFQQKHWQVEPLYVYTILLQR